MAPELGVALMAAIALLFCSAFVVIGLLTVKKAREVELKLAGYIVAIVSGAMAFLLPLYILWNTPVN